MTMKQIICIPGGKFAGLEDALMIVISMITTTAIAARYIVGVIFSS